VAPEPSHPEDLVIFSIAGWLRRPEELSKYCADIGLGSQNQDKRIIFRRCFDPCQCGNMNSNQNDIGLKGCRTPSLHGSVGVRGARFGWALNAEAPRSAGEKPPAQKYWPVARWRETFGREPLRN
jgi:hypothetical protein